MADKLVVLVGGGGFLGRYVAQALLPTGVRLRVAERDPRRAFHLRPLAALGQIQFAGADVTRPDTIDRALAGADAVVNLVGSFAGDLRRIHVDGARAIAAAATRHGLSAMVQVSAIGADAGSDSYYAQTKGEGEAAVREAFPAATILRPSTVFGREDQFINRFAGMIAKLPLVPVVRSRTRFQPVFAGDVGDAVLAAIRDPERLGGRTFELGGPDVMTMGEIQAWIARTIGRKPRFVDLPDAVAGKLPMLPLSPISRDQWRLLQHDSVVGAGADGLAALGVTPTPLAAVAPDWLVRYRRHGRFAKRLPA